MNRYILICIFLTTSSAATAQQFVGDNQWVAPQGVATIIAAAGQEYALVTPVLALLPEWEFNAQLIHYYDDPRTNTESYTTGSLFVKRRLYQNESETAGYAAIGGFGLFPQHLDRGEVIDAFQSWWAMAVATYAFANNNVLLDLLPGATVNFDHNQSSNTAWGFTYSSSVAVSKCIPQSAKVTEVFGTAGEDSEPLSYRAGVRWESTKLILTATYSIAFQSSYGAGFENGLMYYTEPLFN